MCSGISLFNPLRVVLVLASYCCLLILCQAMKTSESLIHSFTLCLSLIYHTFSLSLSFSLSLFFLIETALQQLDGLNWILRCYYQRRSCILADEMGLGKTVQVVTTLEHLWSREGLAGPFLVVVPLSTIDHWAREFEAWADLTTCVYYDPSGGSDSRAIIRDYEWCVRRERRENISAGSITVEIRQPEIFLFGAPLRSSLFCLLSC